MEQSKLKKAIIFDCDNTLWEGVVGEDVINPNWVLRDEIIMLAKRGVIIGICSKNNEQDVIPILQKSLLLWDDYIAVYRINWKDKASNLKEIAEELNIGMGAIVFVDDSSFELGLVRNTIPEVLAILPEELSWTISKWFDLSGDLTKTQQYKENYARTKYQEQFTNIDDYLRSLEMVLTIRKAIEDDAERITELSQKTNQFNLTTKRYSLAQVDALILTHPVYVLSVRDKFGNSGLTGVCVIKGSVIDTFLLSCRVLGRNIEYAFMAYVIQDQQRRGCSGLIGKRVESAKNQQTESFYSLCGFHCVNKENDITTFTFSFNIQKIIPPSYFTYE